MATVTVYPNADGTIGSGWADAASGTTNLYQSIDEGTGSPNDSDYAGSGTSNSTIFFQFDDMPGDFGTLTGYSLKVRLNHSSTKGDYHYLTACQLYKADESTAIAASHTISSTTTITTYTFSTTPTYTDKTSWDGVRCKFTINNAGGGGSGRVYAAQLDLTYDVSSNTYNESGSGGSLGGGLSSELETINIIATGGALLGGLAFAEGGVPDLVGSGGAVIGGSGSPSVQMSELASGGALLGGSAFIFLETYDFGYQVSSGGLVIPSSGETALVLDLSQVLMDRETTLTLRLYTNTITELETHEITYGDFVEPTHPDYYPGTISSWGASVTSGDGAIVTADTVTFSNWGTLGDDPTQILGWWISGDTTGIVYAIHRFDSVFELDVSNSLEIHPIIFLKGVV